MKRAARLLVAALFGLTACSSDNTNTLTVSAAASLTDSFTALGAAFEQVSSEGMAKNVRIDTFSNIGISSCFLDNIPYAHAAKGSTSLV